GLADGATVKTADGASFRINYTPTGVTLTALGGAPGPEGGAAGAVHYVHSLYRTVLHREADRAGLDGWVAALQAGLPRRPVVRAFWESQEHRGRQVDAFYVTYLGRAADAAGRAHWVDRLRTGAGEAEVIQGFLTSAEYVAAHTDVTDYLHQLY